MVMLMINIQSEENIPKNSLILLSLVFSVIFLLLDYHFHAPRVDFIDSIISTLYSISIGCIMLVLSSSLQPDIIDKIPIIKKHYFNFLISFSIILLSIVLMLDIKTTGGIPFSPYSAFLSSFPIFCVVMMFGGITVRSCVKAILLIVSIYFLVEFIDFIIVSFLDAKIIHEEVNSFLKSDVNKILSTAILFVTITSNICSILLAQQVVSPDS